jgi:hypothetical protein
LADVSAVFFPSFFFIKLLDFDTKRPKYNFKAVQRWNKRIFKGKSVGDVKMLVFLQNEGNQYWKCFAIFTDLKIIQAFDFLGNRRGASSLPISLVQRFDGG